MVKKSTLEVLSHVFLVFLEVTRVIRLASVRIQMFFWVIVFVALVGVGIFVRRCYHRYFL